MSFLSQPLRGEGLLGGGSDLVAGLVADRVVAGAVSPAGPDHPQPGASEDAYRVGMALVAGTGVVVDLRGPGAGVAAVVGERGDGYPGSPVGGVAEGHGARLARGPGHWHDAGLGDELFAGLRALQDR